MNDWRFTASRFTVSGFTVSLVRLFARSGNVRATGNVNGPPASPVRTRFPIAFSNRLDQAQLNGCQVSFRALNFWFFFFEASHPGIRIALCVCISMCAHQGTGFAFVWAQSGSPACHLELEVLQLAFSRTRPSLARAGRTWFSPIAAGRSPGPPRCSLGGHSATSPFTRWIRTSRRSKQFVCK